ncbi:porphobilinogen deaminase [Orbilia oligospora]|uniref:Porphobilinogen deaminase n=1 Tax=Orbilia oligospora TaxID=2813651 RepID=A0A6G1MA90_ORBOL|nr:porphobilinogen deaminase [Orbilia oligospora]KAF3197932.1 porphobilinogen deaminase [Orbilia oligospora]KAF3209118.1 porphobilinogen deaminase [Orbilia oligospora]KAF3222111.1 porphobilinogen deaminase [Orbilia oligospora]KAF3249943.1 porphobilinogen deaminase [Orbilia oligospora]
MSEPTASATAATAGGKVYRIGTRSSRLAMIQTNMVRDALVALNPTATFEITSMKTMGDKDKVTALHSFGAKSLWTLELEALLLEKEVDLIVHSLKDMPTQLPPGCIIGSILEREDPRDALIMKAGSPHKSLDDLPPGSVIGTSSVRRGAQILKRYPHLKLENARGNVDTRLRKLDDPESPYSCIILAAAGLIRMGLQDRITAYLSSPTLLHAVGQGAIGVEIRSEDPEVAELVKPLTHIPTYLCALSERQLMRTLEGGCSVPIGVETKFLAEDGEKGNRIHMKASVSSVDGRQTVEIEDVLALDDEISGLKLSVTRAEDVGRLMAARMLDQGAGTILNAIQRSKDTDPQAAKVAEKESEVEEAMRKLVEKQEASEQ